MDASLRVRLGLCLRARVLDELLAMTERVLLLEKGINKGGVTGVAGSPPAESTQLGGRIGAGAVWSLETVWEEPISGRDWGEWCRSCDVEAATPHDGEYGRKLQCCGETRL